MRILAVLVTTVLLAGCGGEPSGWFCGTERPRTSNLVLSPGSAVVGDGGGSVDVTVTFDYTAPEVRINYVYYQVFDASGRRIVDAEIEQTLRRGSGTFSFDIALSTQSPETYRVRVQLLDNCITASFWIEATFEVRMIAALAGKMGYAVVPLNGFLYFIGGRDDAGPVSDALLRFDPATQELQTMARMPEGRESAAAATYNGVIYVFGGHAFGLAQESTFAYDTATDTWTAVAPLSTATSGAAATTVDGMIYLDTTGGRYRYDPVLDLWTSSASRPAVPRH